jgi:hypothetical protein
MTNDMEGEAVAQFVAFSESQNCTDWKKNPEDISRDIRSPDGVSNLIFPVYEHKARSRVHAFTRILINFRRKIMVSKVACFS